MSETCFSFREERRRRQLPGAPREQRKKGVRWLLAIAALLLLLSACRTPGEQPVPTPRPSPTPRPFTVMSTDQIRVTDPAAITDAAEAQRRSARASPISQREEALVRGRGQARPIPKYLWILSNPKGHRHA